MMYSGSDILARRDRIPGDATGFVTSTGDRYALDEFINTCLACPNMMWLSQGLFLDPKGFPVANLSYIFQGDELTLELDLGCRHEAASVPLQRSDRNLNWWQYCKTCGDWMYEAPVPGNNKGWKK